MKTNTKKYIVPKNPDSYDKLAISLLEKDNYEHELKNVHPKDRVEILGELGKYILKPEYQSCNNIRIYEDTLFRAYERRKNSGRGRSFDISVKTLSGRKYLVGFNY